MVSAGRKFCILNHHPASQQPPVSAVSVSQVLSDHSLTAQLFALQAQGDKPTWLVHLFHVLTLSAPHKIIFQAIASDTICSVNSSTFSVNF